MFCQNCGKEVSEETKFCPSCGNAINQASSKNENKEGAGLLNELKKYYEHFSKLSDVYNLYRIGNSLTNDLDWQKKVKSNLIAGWIFFIIGTLGFIITLIPTIQSEGILLIAFWQLFIFEIVFSIVGLVFIIKNKKRKATLKFYTDNLPIFSQKISDHYQKLPNCSLPIEYTDSTIIPQLISLLDSKRADNLKEAINLFEDECHKAEVRNDLKATKKAAKEGDVPKVSFLSFSGLTRKSKCIYCNHLEIVVSSTTMTFRTY